MDGYPPYANLVYDVATLSWVRMTQPLVDSLTSNIYLAVDGVEQLLTDIKGQVTTISGYTDGVEGLPRRHDAAALVAAQRRLGEVPARAGHRRGQPSGLFNCGDRHLWQCDSVWHHELE